MKHYDAIVVGAGPAGGHVAALLAKLGFSVGLFEEHNEIGRPVQCAGLVSPRVFDILGSKPGIQNEITGARVHSPSDQTLDIISESPKACVIDRVKFDWHIVSGAVSSGCELHLGVKVKELKRHGVRTRIKTRSEGKILECEGRIVLGCDGVGSVVVRSFGFPKPKEVLAGFGAECVGKIKGELNHLDIFVGNNIAPGFFAWLIPVRESEARLGLCTARDKRNTRAYFQNLLSHKAVIDRVKDIKVANYVSGAIPLGLPRKIVGDGIMLVGDSACHVKPLSGGGIYLGLLAGGFAAKVAGDALEADDMSEKRLRLYPKMVRDEVGKELRRAYQLKKIYRNLKDEHIEEGFLVLNDEKILGLLGKKGDIDYPSGLTKAVLKKAPKLMKFAGPVLKSLI